MSALLETGPSIMQLNALARQIELPRDFCTGVGTAGEALPSNILLFMPDSKQAIEANPRHRSHHHRTVLIVALHGSGHVCIDAESFPLKAGEALMIFPFQFHSCANYGEASWLFLTFERLTLDSLEPLRSTGPRPLRPMEWMLLEETLHCWLQKERRGLLGQHFGLLLDRVATIPRPSPRSVAAPSDDCLEVGSPNSLPPAPMLVEQEPKTQMLVLINSHALPLIDSEHNPLNVASLARALNLSESHLRTQFRKTTGRSLGRHLRTLRLQRACSLLRTTRLSVTEVAALCGFVSVYSFSRTFRAVRGVTPSTYRKGRFEIPPSGVATKETATGERGRA